jgi:hypothetical protein
MTLCALIFGRVPRERGLVTHPMDAVNVNSLLTICVRQRTIDAWHLPRTCRS